MTEKTSAASGVDISGLVVAAILFGLAFLMWREAQSMGGAVTYGMGPTAALKIVGGGLVLLGVFTILNAFRSRGPRPETMDAVPVLIVMAACVVMIACIHFGAGFIPAMTILFAATATAFGRRNIPADIGIGFCVGLVIYLLFSRILTLTLPQGPLERLIG